MDSDKKDTDKDLPKDEEPKVETQGANFSWGLNRKFWHFLFV
jgi:hypothetical protein